MKSKLKMMRVIIGVLSLLLTSVTVFAMKDVFTNEKLYEVKLETNGSENSLEPIKVKANDIVKHIQTPSKEGHSFIEWYFDSQLTEKYTKEVKINENITLFAKWKVITYFIMFDTNGGSMVSPIIYNHGDLINQIEQTTRKDGFIFEGWFFDESFDTPFEQIFIKKHMTLYAKWQSTDVIIAFDSNGGDKTPQINHQSGDTIEKLPIPNYYGHVFIGWAKTDESTTIYNEKYVVSKNETLIAQWEKKTFTIGFVKAQGESVTDLKEQIYLSQVYVNPLHDENFNFLGWYTDEECNKQFFNGTLLEKDIVLYAKWEPITYNIEFNTNGGNELNPIVVESGSKPLNVPMPKKDGNTFLGWYLDLNLSSKFDVNQELENSIILHAKWKINTYSIIYSNENDTVEYKVVYKEEIPVVENPTKDGYMFVGWVDEVNKPFILAKMPNRNILLTAKFEINTYLVSFDATGGIPTPMNKEYRHGSEFLMDEPFARREGYSLIGWYEDLLNETTRWDFNQPHTMVKDIKFYAKWDPNKSTIKYYIDDAFYGDQKTVFNETLNLLTPQKNGYDFIGWFENDKLFLLEKMPNRDVIVIAKWTEKSYTIDFYEDYLTDVSYKYLSVIEKPGIPIRNGFNFINWYLDENFNNVFNLTVMPSHDITVYAKWEIKPSTIGFESNGGTKIDAIYGNSGDIAIEPNTPYKEGYSFEGWYSDIDLTVAYIFDTIPESGIILYAKWNEVNYKITFKSNSLTEIDVLFLSYGAHIPILTTPILSGYVFENWYEDYGFTQVFNLSEMPSRDIILYAKWIPIYYSIVFDASYNIPSIISESGLKINKPEDPVKLGYNFEGWFSDLNDIDPFVFDLMPNENTILYAKWSLLSFELKFNTNGGDLITSVFLDYKETLELIMETKKIGYTFEGWYSDGTLKQKVTQVTMATKNVTLHAKFTINKYEVTFVDGSVETKVKYNYNSIIGFVPDKKIGHSLVGWYIDSSMTLPYDMAKKMPSEDFILYAKWQANNYEITFITNSINGIGKGTYKYLESISKPVNPEKEGYSFIGWYADIGLTELYKFTFMPPNDIVLYAGWQVNRYTITFNSNNGIRVDDESHFFGDAVTYLPELTFVGSTFKGWFLGDVQIAVSLDNPYIIKQNLALTAKWELNSYSISFETNNGSSVPKVVQVFGSQVNEPIAVTKTGYTFMGWFKDADYSTPFQFTYMPAQNITIYAKWDLNKYTISFNSNGGPLINNQVYFYGDEITTLPTLKLDGYIFGGWYLDSNFNEIIEISDLNPHLIEKNIQLYAKLTIGIYKITYDTMGGNTIISEEYPYLGVLMVPEAPIKEDYEFEGWFIDNQLTTKFIFNRMTSYDFIIFAKWSRVNPIEVEYVLNNGEQNDLIFYQPGEIGSMIKHPVINKEGHKLVAWYLDDLFISKAPLTLTDYNITLYAKWAVNNYKITFDSDGGSGITDQIKAYGSTIVKPKNPVKKGHTFKGWYVQDEVYVFSEMPAFDIELTAKWIVNSFTITFDSKEGSVVDSIYLPYGETVIEPVSPTRENHQFLGWFDSKGDEFVFNAMTDKNQTLVAKWNLIPEIIYVTKAQDFYSLENESVILVIEFNDDNLTNMTVEINNLMPLILYPLKDHQYELPYDGIEIDYSESDSRFYVTLNSSFIKNELENGLSDIRYILKDKWHQEVSRLEVGYSFTVNYAPTIKEVTESQTITLIPNNPFVYKVVIKGDDTSLVTINSNVIDAFKVYAIEGNPYGSIAQKNRLNSRGIFVTYSYDTITKESIVSISFDFDYIYINAFAVPMEITSVVEDYIGNKTSDVKRIYTFEF